MLDLINFWQFNLLGYLIFIVIFFQLYKLAAQQAKSDGAVTVLLQVIAAVSACIWVVFYPIRFPTALTTYLLFGTACLFYAVNDRLQTTARKHLPVSTYAVLSQLSTVFIFIFGLTIFQEPFEVYTLLGVLLIVAGNAFLLYEKGKIFFNKYAWITVVIALSFAIAVSIDVGISSQFSLPLYIGTTFFVPALLVFASERIPVSTVTREWTHGNRKLLFMTGFSWGIAVLFLLRAYQAGEVTVIGTLQATSVLLNVLVAHVFFNENDKLVKKIVAAGLVFLGIYLTIV